MEFQDVIPFFIFMIWLFSLFGKKRKKAETGSSPQKPSPLKSIIRNIARQIKEQAEAARREQERTTRQTPGGDRSGLQAPDLSVAETGSPIDIALTDTETRLPDETASTGKDRKEADPVRQNGHSEVFRQPSNGTSSSKRQLRNAVVWSEILGEPVALRRDHLKLR